MIKVTNMREVSLKSFLEVTATIDFVYFWVFKVPTKVFRPTSSINWRRLDTGAAFVFANPAIESLYLAYWAKERMNERSSKIT